MLDAVFAIMQEELALDITGMPFELENRTNCILIYLYGQYIGNINIEKSHIVFHRVYVRRGENAICKVTLSDPGCFSIIKERIIMSLSEIHRKKYNGGTIV